MADNGRRGVLILRPGATRLEVMEELVHHGQHVRAGLRLPTDSAQLALVQVQREIEAQDILLRIARNQNWTAEEVARITANREVWVRKLARLTGQE
jgi:acyl CoA:acetate/3-ketoacid CoA transferase beta subunit